MTDKLESLLRQKQNDRLFQIIVGIFALAMVIFTYGIPLFFLGIVHAISTLYWAFKKEVPRTMARRNIQSINIAVLIQVWRCKWQPGYRPSLHRACAWRILFQHYQ